MTVTGLIYKYLHFDAQGDSVVVTEANGQGVPGLLFYQANLHTERFEQVIVVV